MCPVVDEGGNNEELAEPGSKGCLYVTVGPGIGSDGVLIY